MATSKHAALIDQLRERIRTAGLRVTAPRVAVLQRLHGATSPSSHADLVDALAPQGWDRATLFRILNDLADAGLVHRVDVGDHVWRFELCAEETPHAGGEHPHFVCNECGDVVCLPDADVRVNVRGGPRALRTKRLEVQIKGRCDRCT
jgi:Fur family ferric uptake transcriptional regulator